MKKKKGFTLVELLAVIVILALLILIAVPNVIKIMNNAKKNTARDNVLSLVRLAGIYYTSDLSSTLVGEDDSFACSVTQNGCHEINYDGEEPTGG